MSAISIVPLLNFINLLCCAGIMIGGYVGVVYYNKECVKFNVNITNKDAVFIGLLSGLLSGVIVSGFTILTAMFSDLNPMVETTKMLTEMGIPVTPEAEEIIKKLSMEFDKYGFSPTLSIVTFVLNLIIYPVFGMFGSLISYSLIVGKKNLHKDNV
ncbi:MAG: hypothetical protein B6D43_04550 [Ignavibacteriales bacterium UTCHB1]|nr:hypothetical protein [Ignavibacteria bacterium]OQY77783.1 MAG: hypothetical protein B6D43_04550 [Ignavibacteriales bacterium UTCHB1]